MVTAVYPGYRDRETAHIHLFRFAGNTGSYDSRHCGPGQAGLGWDWGFLDNYSNEQTVRNK